MKWALAFTEVLRFICSKQMRSVCVYKPLALSLRWPMPVRRHSNKMPENISIK